MIDAALGSAHASKAVTSAEHLFSDLDRYESVTSVAIGKAALPMAFALERLLPRPVDKGVLSGYVTPEALQKFPLSEQWQIFAGGHPLPDAASFAAGNAAVKMLSAANTPADLVVFLISGGGSAMIEKGIDGIRQSDIIEANQILVNCGADIDEINAVRKSFSAIKGGGLARLCPEARQITLIVSDTEPDDQASVASGPSIFDGTRYRTKARDVIAAFALEKSLSASIIAALDVKYDDLNLRPSDATVTTVLQNKDVLSAAAGVSRSLGFETVIADDIRQNDVADGVRTLLDAGRKTLRDTIGKTVCIISGGEFSCQVRGSGVGGRNAESVLRMAMELDKAADEFNDALFISIGTDGIDGNSSAAGAFCDKESVKIAAAKGVDAAEMLANSDANTFFAAIGNDVVTGPTLTNVRDVRILLLK